MSLIEVAIRASRCSWACRTRQIFPSGWAWLAALLLAALQPVLGLGPGDVAFIGYNSDGNDDFAIVALAEIPAATTIYFRDDEWGGSAFNTGEAWQQWVSGGSAIPAGTVISFNTINTTGRTVSAGSLTAGVEMNLAGSNEGLWAYQGSDKDTPTNFLAFIGDDTLANTANSLANTGLSEGSTALAISGDEDIMAYTGTRTNKSAAEFLALIGNSANWTTENGSGDQSTNATPPDVPFDATTFTLVTPLAGPPTALAASLTNATSFVAEWTAISGATGYQLDVATNAAFTPSGSNPITNDFEGATWPPTDWTMNSVDQSTTYAHGGTYSAKLGAAGDSLITPISQTPGTLTFWTYTTATDPAINIEYSNHVGGPWTAATGSPFSGNTEQWNERTIDLSALASIYIRFTKAGSGTLYVDDLELTDLDPGDDVSGYENRPVTGGAITSTTVSGLSLDTTYYYRVRATNATSESANSNTQTVQTATLSAPVALPATATNETRFTAAWTAVDGATGYRLDVATNGAFTTTPAGGVILSEMCDPATDYQNNRFIEIYNAGATAVDLTGWKVVAIGNNSDIFTWPLSGTIAPAEALVCGDDAASTVGFDPDFQAPTWSDNNSTWNGGTNDGARLETAESAIVDRAYSVDNSGDETEYRLATIATGQTVFAAAEWTDAVASDATDGTPGQHTCNYPNWSGGDFVPYYESLDVGSVTNYSVTNLTPETTYHYRVRAYASEATGPASNTQAVTTPAHQTQPTVFLFR